MDLNDSLETQLIKYSVLFVGSAFILALTTLVLFDDSDDYTLITKDTELSGRVSNIDRRHGMLFFNVQDTIKYKVSGHMRNYEYPEDSFFFFLSGGDWIDKRRGTDTLLITRHVVRGQNNYYIFVLGKELNRELKRSQ